MYCEAAFWGPITAQNTAFLALQSLDEEMVGINIFKFYSFLYFLDF